MSEIPYYWGYPVQSSQRTLFEEDRDDVLLKLQVSLDTLEGWRGKGWISFDATQMKSLDEPEIWEIAFVRNIACSGLSDATIDILLSGLAKPYRYHPGRVAYNFAYGWVQSIYERHEVDVYEFFDEHFEDWVRHNAGEDDLYLLNSLIEILQSRVADIEITLLKSQSEDDGQ
ncbi:MAG: hypothetical protein NT023_07975 [Armatimonadetes bacterium]|nr:hypothetical protein [Armatimonadota bacterium]